MPLFWKPYKSDVTQFIDELRAKKPTLEAEQRAGRGLLWDRPPDREARLRRGPGAAEALRLPDRA